MQQPSTIIYKYQFVDKYISQSVESQSLWIIHSSAFDHISGNTSICSLSFLFLKFLIL